MLDYSQATQRTFIPTGIELRGYSAVTELDIIYGNIIQNNCQEFESPFLGPPMTLNPLHESRS